MNGLVVLQHMREVVEKKNEGSSGGPSGPKSKLDWSQNRLE